MLLVVALVTVLPIVLGASAVKEENQWPTPIIPNLKVTNIIERGLADFSGSVPLKMKMDCDLKCLAERMQQVMNSNEVDQMFSYETLYENGSVVLTEINVDKSTLVDQRQQEEDTPEISRQKREIYGYDTRFVVTDKEYLSQYPFNAVVKLSTGCTGTLISQKYVLTAAQCVHDGTAYVKGTKQLKVGFRRDRIFEEGPPASDDDQLQDQDKDFYWIRATEIKVPQGWMKRRGRDSKAAEYDYAVIRLKRPHDKDFMDIGITGPSLIYPGRRLHFSAFDDYNSTDLLYRFCPVGDFNNDMLYHFCDSKPMAAGAGLYVRLWDSLKRDWRRKVLAVFSGHVWVEDGDIVGEYNAAVLITPLKYAQICFWLEGDFSSCSRGDE